MEIFCLLFRRYLPKNNQRRREKTPVEESRSSHISGTDVLTLKAKERLIERCRNRGKTTSVESCNRHTYTKHSHPLTYTHNCRTLTPRKKTKTRTNNVLFSILVYCPSWRKARRRRRRDGAADRRVKKENTEKIVIL